MDFHIWIERIRQVRKAFRFLKKRLSVHKKHKKRQLRKEKKQCRTLFRSFSHFRMSVPVKLRNIRKKAVGTGRILWGIRNRYF